MNDGMLNIPWFEMSRISGVNCGWGKLTIHIVFLNKHFHDCVNLYWQIGKKIWVVKINQYNFKGCQKKHILNGYTLVEPDNMLYIIT